MFRPALVISVAAVLAGCVLSSPAPKTVEAECRLIPEPPHAVKARTSAGQDWADDLTETGVRVCGYPRPAPNPVTTTQRRAFTPSVRSVRPQGARPQTVQPRAPTMRNRRLHGYDD